MSIIVIYIIKVSNNLYLIINDVRSTHNVGSILRTADGFAVKEVFICGYSPYPSEAADSRPPHIANKIDKSIKKTALGAELSQKWSKGAVLDVLMRLKQNNVLIAALEQDSMSCSLTEFIPTTDIAVIVGNELSGLDKAILNLCDVTLEIPMLGKKESFNVSVAAAIALFYLRNMLK